MKHTLFTILATLFLCFSLHAQDLVVKPIPVDKNLLSGVGLRKIDLKDEPEKDFYQRMVFNGEDIMVFIVSTETWDNKIDNYSFDEYVYLLHGQSIVKPKIGAAKTFDYADHIFMPKNFEGNWEIRAGENLHYELSVISKKRSDSTVVSTNKNYENIDKSRLSGCQINVTDNEIYKELIREGVELKVSLYAEKPNERILEASKKEKLIFVASGKIGIQNTDEEQSEFFTGDFFIIPKGMKGTWNCDGHGLVKYLVIEKAGN